MKRLIYLFLTLAAGTAFCDDATVVFHDDFEATSTASPPLGWTMWGAEQYKTPSNYTHDTTNPHTGQACFRIHHPARTGGYIVSSLERAIRPKPAMIYTVSFWARAGKPGTAMFFWTAYRTIEPFVDAPSPGTFKFDTSPEWKEFSFTVREGLDLFAGQSRFLLLSFTAATKSKEEGTLWIDDVRVSEKPDPHPATLLNDDAIPHDALQHRLRSGDRLEFVVDATKRLRRATQDVGGVSFQRVCGWTGQPYNKRGDYTLAPELETAIREMRLPMTRFYAVGDERFSIESAIDKVADVLRRVGVAEERCVLEFEREDAGTKLPPEMWARGVAHSLQRHYKFHYWEIANEPYASMWGNGGQAFLTAETFIAHFKAVSRAIRAVDPQAQIGMDINSDSVKWGNYLLKNLAGDYDFVAPHYYCGANIRKLPFEEIVLTENYRILDRALRTQALIRAYNHDRDVYQYDTEWGMICNAPNGKDADYEGRNANIIGTLHRAVRLIYYAREEILRGASGWEMFSRLDGPGFGILSQEAPEKRFMLYWLYYYFNRHVGEWALATEGVAPYYQPKQETDRAQFSGPLTPTLATLSRDDHELYLVIANGSWTRAVPCRVHLRNFAVARATGVVLTNSNLDGSPLLDRKEDAVMEFSVAREGNDVTCAIPAHAVVFVTLEQSK
jgi:sulfur carrier protein ThiS